MRPVFRLEVDHETAKSMFKYLPISGRVLSRVTRFNKKNARLCYTGQNMGSKQGRYVFITVDNKRCHACDLVGFIKYGKWYRYEPIDGDYSNLKWSNLRRVYG